MTDLNNEVKLVSWDPRWQNGAPLVRVELKLESRGEKVFDFIARELAKYPADKYNKAVLGAAAQIYNNRMSLTLLCLYRLDGQLAGALGMARSEVAGLLTMPGAKGRGVGRTLIEEAVRHACKDRGDVTGEVSLIALDDEAKAFYEKIGFVGPRDGMTLRPQTSAKWRQVDGTYKYAHGRGE